MGAFVIHVVWFTDAEAAEWTSASGVVVWVWQAEGSALRIIKNTFPWWVDTHGDAHFALITVGVDLTVWILSRIHTLTDFAAAIIGDKSVGTKQSAGYIWALNGITITLKP